MSFLQSLTLSPLIYFLLYRKIYDAIAANSYEIRRSYRYSTWPITRKYQLCSGNISNVHRCRNAAFEARRNYASNAMIQEKKSRKMLMYLTALVFGMVGMSYAAVPLYRRFCQATGYGGTVQRREVRFVYLIYIGL